MHYVNYVQDFLQKSLQWKLEDKSIVKEKKIMAQGQSEFQYLLMLRNIILKICLRQAVVKCFWQAV